MLEPESEILCLLFVETFKNARRNAAAKVSENQHKYYIFLSSIGFELW